jgi:hypothetical protein
MTQDEALQLDIGDRLRAGEDEVDFLWLNDDDTAHVVYPDGREADVPVSQLSRVAPNGALPSAGAASADSREAARSRTATRTYSKPDKGRAAGTPRSRKSGKSGAGG